uniref:C3H1-type domain-containing protein n=1 Tax=Trichobilharzia regenti TaxID=157069 RepID=A0AA85IRB6_TRIRE|nr:unnamed protein product [Trichobilharzia regenti]
MDQQSSSYSSRFHYKKIVRKAVRSLKFRRRPVCQIYCRTGKCPSVTCAFTHDENYLRICPKFLLRICPLGKDACPLAHVLDPCRLPQCSFYESGNCDRDQCPYLHVNYPPDTAVCSDFTMGRCSRGRLCNKRHVWLRKSVTNKSGRQKVFNVKITTKSNNANDEASVCSKPKVDNHSTLTTAPAGSLRNVFPAPEFIPLLSESDYLNAATDKSCL